jgi:hypothetical protein
MLPISGQASKLNASIPRQAVTPTRGDLAFINASVQFSLLPTGTCLGSAFPQSLHPALSRGIMATIGPVSHDPIPNGLARLPAEPIEPGLGYYQDRGLQCHGRIRLDQPQSLPSPGVCPRAIGLARHMS